jgi:2-phospho-L-lactate guanylyltransferase
MRSAQPIGGRPDLGDVGGGTLRWSVVIPLKPLHLAKTRLRGLPPRRRQALVAAMALDVRDAVLGCPDVAEIVIVTRDARWRTILGQPRTRFVADSAHDTLNDALRRGAAACRRDMPDHGIAALPGDLPALTAEELAAALVASSELGSAFVPDAHGDGTTLLAARPSSGFEPRYGRSSRSRHREAGATELDFPHDSGLRQDVDSLQDLAAARAIGLGRHTRTALAAAADPEVTVAARAATGPSLADSIPRRTRASVTR